MTALYMTQGPATERHLIWDLMLAVKRRQPRYNTVLTNYTKGVMSAAEAATALFVPVPKTKHCERDGAQRPMFVHGFNFFPSCTSDVAAFRRQRRQRAIARFFEKKWRRQAARRVAGRHKHAVRTSIASRGG